MSSLQGRRKLERRLKAIGDTSDLLRRVQLDTIAGAKRRVPRKTGHLGRSIVPGSVNDERATIEVRTPYAAAVECLFTRQVHHPTEWWDRVGPKDARAAYDQFKELVVKAR